MISSVFRSGDYLSTLLRIAQPANAPPSFFSWNEPAGGLIASPTCGWPKYGYTLFCWIRVESFPRNSSSLPVYVRYPEVICRFALRGVNRRAIEACIQEKTFIVRCLSEKGEESCIRTSLDVKDNTWFWLGVTHVKKSMWRSTMSVFCNDHLLVEDKFMYPENLDGGAKGALSLTFARSENQGYTASDGQDYRFQMCSMGMMQSSLSEVEMNQLYMLHHGPSYSLCETTSVDQWSVIQQRLFERVGAKIDY